MIKEDIDLSHIDTCIGKYKHVRRGNTIVFTVKKIVIEQVKKQQELLNKIHLSEGDTFTLDTYFGFYADGDWHDIPLRGKFRVKNYKPGNDEVTIRIEPHRVRRDLH